MLLEKDNKISTLQQNILPLQGNTQDYDQIINMAAESQIVLIGEATHGTEEFYRMRAEISKLLIKENGFNAIAIEGDWPDTYRVNQYVKGEKSIKDANDALLKFMRFPTWMWRNEIVLEFIEWLHNYNLNLQQKKKVGLYGLDLYSLNASIIAVIDYLDKIDKVAANKARERYACFDHFKDDLQNYGLSASIGLSTSCEEEVVTQLTELYKNKFNYLSKIGFADEDCFYALQNAHLVMNAEKYYRSMFSDRISSWNVRDTHMADTLSHLMKHLTITQDRSAKVIVWAHNSHLGDARATSMGKILHELNLGQLVREKFEETSLLIGFLTYTGTVTAASRWDGIAEKMYVRPALPESYEYFFHYYNLPNFFLNIKNNKILKDILPYDKLERAIGVIYLPHTERYSHYFNANIARQFDAFFYLKTTTAVRPLEMNTTWHRGEAPETFPFGV
jgi:erythromycin esterase-like protein